AQGYSFLEASRLATLQFLAHLHPSFLLFGETTTLRHGDGIHGVLYPTTFILVFGCITWITWNLYKKHRLPKEIVTMSLIAGVLILLGILPAAIATEVPHSNRALTASVGFWMLSVVGILELLRWAEQHQEVRSLRDSRDRKSIYFQLIIGTYVLLHTLFAVKYVSHYFKGFAQDSADAFKDGYLAAFEYVIPYETGSNGTHEVQNIIFTSKYGQPYIYALFARKTNPIYFHGGSLIKYLFQDSFVEGDLHRDNTIIVTSPDDVMPFEKAEYVVSGSDGKPRFYIFDTTTVKW
ncbi:hypothetical protein KC721_00400, partial [Candidatus Woesebacteria bacterium]|nr:hypothetical protein [Candidatus Woesebacteria bacterium]